MPGRRFQLTAWTQPEHELQISCTRMLQRLLLPDVAWTAIDHAHSLNREIGRHGREIGLLEMAKRKERGIKDGIPDYAFWHRGGSFAIELKRDADAPLSVGQEKFLTELLAAGCRVSVCWTIDQVFRKANSWGLLRSARITA